MIVTLRRYQADGQTTLGLVLIEGWFECYSLERSGIVPAGIYEAKLRTKGGLHKKYSDKFMFHRGMIWLRKVPARTFIQCHIGNKLKDTKGCILLGDTANNNEHDDGYIGYSTNAYMRFYTKLVPYFGREQVFFHIIDPMEVRL